MAKSESGLIGKFLPRPVPPLPPTDEKDYGPGGSAGAEETEYERRRVAEDNDRIHRGLSKIMEKLRKTPLDEVAAGVQKLTWRETMAISEFVAKKLEADANKVAEYLVLWAESMSENAEEPGAAHHEETRDDEDHPSSRHSDAMISTAASSERTP